MANLAYRRESVQRLVGSYLAPAASYTVTVYQPGGQAAANSSGTTITLRAGHGFSAGNKIGIWNGTTLTFSGSDTVQSTTSSSIVMGNSYSVSSGDYIVNLGSDTGTSSPNYDASTASIYTDMAGAGTAISNSRVTCNSGGEYAYYLGLQDGWELIRDGSGTVVGLVPSITPTVRNINVDIDSDGTYELFTGTVSGYPRILNLYDNIDMTAVSGTNTYTGSRMELNFTGSTAQTFTREGTFSILRCGATTAGANSTGGQSGGSAIAAGNYVEFRGDGTQSSNSMIGTEAAMTMYNQGTVATGYGLLGICSVDNSGAGGTATVTTGYGVRGIARIMSGSTGAYTTAVGVDGTVSHAGTGTIASAIGGQFDVGNVGGTITTAYGVKIGTISEGGTANYGLHINGASGGSGTNAAIWVESGNVYFRDAGASALAQFRMPDIYIGATTDVNLRIHFDTLTSEGVFRYMGLTAVNEFDMNKPLRVTGEVRAGGDSAGVANYVSLTNTSNIAAAGATFTVKGVSGATARDNSGWVKIYVGTTAYYLPVWATITG